VNWLKSTSYVPRISITAFETYGAIYATIDGEDCAFQGNIHDYNRLKALLKTGEIPAIKKAYNIIKKLRLLAGKFDPNKYRDHAGQLMLFEQEGEHRN
jgi:hypothetical protein